jgi:streptomycin 6-kinase
MAWLDRLPAVVEELTERWSLRPGKPLKEAEASCAYVAPMERADGTPGVLKVGMPHMEGEQEIAGLRFWRGEAMVRLLEADDALGAMLLERCEPGTTLCGEPEPRQDEVIAGLANRLWSASVSAQDELGRFRHVSEMIAYWSEETRAQAARWPDAGLVGEGLRVFEMLARPAADDVLLATDLHAGNVLRAEREPWLAIDPKPFVGERAYDLAQHLINCEGRLHADAAGLVGRVADLAGVDRERLRLWTFARAAADPRDDWTKPLWMDVARALAP